MKSNQSKAGKALSETISCLLSCACAFLMGFILMMGSTV